MITPLRDVIYDLSTQIFSAKQYKKVVSEIVVLGLWWGFFVQFCLFGWGLFVCFGFEGGFGLVWF